jgi:hypothetical protein
LNLNPREILVKILNFYVKHKCTWDAVLDIIDIINCAVEEEIIPRSKYLLMKFFSTKMLPTFHFECKSCKKYGIKYLIGCNIEKELPCCRCKKINSMQKPRVLFVTFEVKKLILKLIEKYEDVLIFSTVENERFPMRDITNGRIYNEIIAKEGPFIAIGINTDGVQRFNATKHSLWPLYFCLYNLPCDIRLHQENLATCGLFYGQHIEMEGFLETFVEEIRKINESGGIKTKRGNFKVFCISASLDAIAKPKLQNQIQFNGYFGCSYCFTKGKPVGKTLKYSNRYATSSYKKYDSLKTYTHIFIYFFVVLI